MIIIATKDNKDYEDYILEKRREVISEKQTQAQIGTDVGKQESITVKKTSFPMNLKHMGSDHRGVRWEAGWNMRLWPMGRLWQLRQLTIKNIHAHTYIHNHACRLPHTRTLIMRGTEEGRKEANDREDISLHGCVYIYANSTVKYSKVGIRYDLSFI